MHVYKLISLIWSYEEKGKTKSYGACYLILFSFYKLAVCRSHLGPYNETLFGGKCTWSRSSLTFFVENPSILIKICDMAVDKELLLKESI